MDRNSRTKTIDRWTRIFSVAWVATFIGSFVWQWRDAHQDAMGFAVAEARAVFDRDSVFHRWASRHGGVRVPEISKGSPPAGSPTPALELINPSELIRRMHSLSLQKNGPAGKIVSLTPLVPDNRPDGWEKAALGRFESGPNNMEIYDLERENGHKVLRYIQPLVVGPSCIQCHSNQWYQVGGHHGGLSVTLSMAPYDRVVRKRVISTAIFHLLFCSVGLVGIAWSSRRFRRHAKMHELSDRRFRLFYENAPIAYQALDSGGRLLEVNGAWLQMLGYVRSEVIGCPLSSLVEPTQLDALADWLANCRNSGQIGFVELKLRTKIGVYVEASLQSCAWQGLDDASSEIHSVVRSRDSASLPAPGRPGDPGLA